MTKQKLLKIYSYWCLAGFIINHIQQKKGSNSTVRNTQLKALRPNKFMSLSMRGFQRMKFTCKMYKMVYWCSHISFKKFITKKPSLIQSYEHSHAFLPIGCRWEGYFRLFVFLLFSLSCSLSTPTITPTPPPTHTHTNTHTHTHTCTHTHRHTQTHTHTHTYIHPPTHTCTHTHTHTHAHTHTHTYTHPPTHPPTHTHTHTHTYTHMLLIWSIGQMCQVHTISCVKKVFM